MKKGDTLKGHADIAIIGGSGVYDVSLFDNIRQIEVDTPFGKPSDSITLGDFGEKKVCFLPRHGTGHRVSPTNLNSRANIFALKKLGVKQIIAASAVGSLKENIKPLDIVIPDQIYDRTKLRPSTFFDQDIVAHTGFADPFCSGMSNLLHKIAIENGYNSHPEGTYVCIEGPQFSTRAESNVYRSLGFDIIGMTATPEAKLAREAEICYSTIATVTDYDVWHEEDVTMETIIGNVIKNEKAVRTIIRQALESLDIEQDCECRHALDGAIMTDSGMIPYETKYRLKTLIGKYIN